jgi:hypothetical protein
MGFLSSLGSFFSGGVSDLVQGKAPLTGTLEAVDAPEWISGLVSPIGTSAARGYDAYKQGDNYSAIHNIMGLSPIIDDASRGAGRWANEKTDGSAGQFVNTIAPVVGGMIGGVYGGPVGAMGGAAAGKMFAGRFNNLPEKDIQKGTAITGATAYATASAGQALSGAAGSGGQGGEGALARTTAEEAASVVSEQGGGGYDFYNPPAADVSQSVNYPDYSTPGGDYLAPDAPQPAQEDASWLKKILDDPRTTDLAKQMAKKSLSMLLQAGMQGLMGTMQTFTPQPAPPPINTNYAQVPTSQPGMMTPATDPAMGTDPAWAGTDSTLPSNPLDVYDTADYSLRKQKDAKDKEKRDAELAAQLKIDPNNYLSLYPYSA